MTQASSGTPWIMDMEDTTYVVRWNHKRDWVWVLAIGYERLGIGDWIWEKGYFRYLYMT